MQWEKPYEAIPRLMILQFMILRLFLLGSRLGINVGANRG